MTYQRLIKRTQAWISLTQKTSFHKWISSINLNNLSEEAKRFIKNFDYYRKKSDFLMTLKALLHVVYE